MAIYDKSKWQTNLALHRAFTENIVRADFLHELIDSMSSSDAATMRRILEKSIVKWQAEQNVKLKVEGEL